MDTTYDSTDFGAGFSATPGADEMFVAAYDTYQRLKESSKSDKYSIAEPVSEQHSPWTYDTDPFGTETRKYGQSIGDPELDGSKVGGITLANGTYMSRADALRTRDGARLIDLADNERQGRRRGFFNALTEGSFWTVLPYISFFADIGGSFADAYKLNEIYKSKKDTGSLSDDEALLVSRHMAEARWHANGNMWATVGDIFKQAPGFCLEFFTSGLLGSGLRTAAAKSAAQAAKAAGKQVTKEAVDKATTLATDRAVKTLSNELADDLLRKTVITKYGLNAGEHATTTAFNKAVRTGLSGLTDVEKTAVRDEMAKQLSGLITTRSGSIFGAESEELISAVSKNLADRSIQRTLARETASTTFKRYMTGAGQTLKDSAVSSLLDWGSMWDADSKTQLFFRQTSAGQALKDAITGLTIEPAIRGSIQYGVGTAVSEAIKFGTTATGLSDNWGVNRTELDLRASAYYNGDDYFNDHARAMGMGATLLEYVSENSGRGFGSALRAIGLKTGLAKAATRRYTTNAAGMLLEGKEAEAGGILRSFVRKAVGTLDEQKAANEATRTGAALEFLGGKIDRAQAAQLARGSIPAGLSAEAKGIVGENADEFMSRALRSHFKVEEGKLANRAFLLYGLSNWMVKNNIGPDQVMDFFKRFGHDGIFEEMLEERYSDFGKGFFALDEAGGDKPLIRLSSLSDAVQALWPEHGMQDWLAEAIGFAIPIGVRHTALRIQKQIGAGPINAARRFGSNMQTALDARTMVESTEGQYFDSVKEVLNDLDTKLTEAENQKKLIEANLRNDYGIAADAPLTGQVGEELVKRSAEITKTIEDLQSRRAAVLDTRTRAYKANGGSDDKAIEEYAAENAEVLGFHQPVSSREKSTDLTSGSKLGTVRSSNELAESLGAKNAVEEDAPYVGMALFDSESSAAPGGTVRRWAQKIVGFGAAVLTGDPSLAANDVVKWALADENVDPHTVHSLKELFKSYRQKTIDAITKERTEAGERSAYVISEKDVRARMWKEYSEAARDVVRTRLALSGARMFTQTEMERQAIDHIAGKLGWDLDPEKDTFSKARPDGTVETITPGEFKARNATEVDSLRNRIAAATLNMLSGSKYKQNFLSVLSFLRVDQKSPMFDRLATDLALRMNGFAGVVDVLDLSEDGNIESQLATDGTKVDFDTIRRIAEAGDNASDGDVKKLFDILRVRMTSGSDEELKSWRAEAIRLCQRTLAVVDTVNTATFTRNVAVAEQYSRLFDDGYNQTITASRTSTGTWRVEYTDTKKMQQIAIERDTKEELAAALAEAGFKEDINRSIVYVSRGHITSKDPFLMARKLGVASLVYKQCINGTDRSHLPPVWRTKQDGTFEYDDKQNDRGSTDANEALEEELRLANLYITSMEGTDKSVFALPGMSPEQASAFEERCKKAYEAAFDENYGYMTVVENVLKHFGVHSFRDTRGLSPAIVSGDVLGGRYSGSIRELVAPSGNTIIPIDYARGQNFSSALLHHLFATAYGKYRYLIAKNGKFNRSVMNFVADVARIVDKAIYDPKTPEETAASLEKFQSRFLNDVEHPTVDTFSELAYAFSAFRAEADAATGIAQTDYSPAEVFIAEQVRNSGWFLSFTSAVDVMVGGDGFVQEAAAASVGAKLESAPDRGLSRYMNLFSETGSKKAVEEAVRKFRPAGMSFKEFATSLNTALTRMSGKESGKVTAPDVTPGLADLYKTVRRIVSEAAKGSDPETAYQALAELAGVVKNLYKGNEKRTVGRVLKTLVDKARDANAASKELPAKIEELNKKIEQLTKDSENTIRAANDAVNEARREERQKLEDERAKYKAMLSRAESILSKVATMSATAAGEITNAATKAALDIVRTASPGEISAAIKELNTALEESRAGLEAGDTPSNLSALASALRDLELAEGEGTDDNFTYTDSFSSIGIDDVPVDDVAVYLADVGSESNPMYKVIERPREYTDLDPLTDVLYGANMLRVFAEVTGGYGQAAGDRVSQYDYLDKVCLKMFPGMNTAERAAVINAMYTLTDEDKKGNDGDIYGKRDATEDDEDNAAMKSSEEHYGEKDAAVFESKPLKCFLAFANLSSPETRKNFQAFLNSVRDNVSSLKTELEDLSAAAENEGSAEELKNKLDVINMLNDLLNPRAVVSDEIDTATKREATAEARIRDFLNGADATYGSKLDQAIRVLMTEDEDGHPLCRKAAFLLTFVRSLKEGARQNLLSLACNSAVCSRVNVRQFSTSDGKNSTMVNYIEGNFKSTGAHILTSSFLPLTLLSKSELQKKVAEFKAAIAEAYPRSAKPEKIEDDMLTRAIPYDQFATIAKLLAPLFGRESPLVQVLTSQTLADYFESIDGEDARKLMNTIARAFSPGKYGEMDNAWAPEAVKTLCDILDAYINDNGSDGPSAERAETMFRYAVAGFQAGIATGTEGFRNVNKTLEADTGWMRLMTAHASSLPETMCRAETMPERSNKIGSSVAISSRGVVPVILRWIDKGISEENSFAKLAFNVWLRDFKGMTRDRFETTKEPEAQKALEQEFLTTVLPRCRQTMTWPNRQHTPILAKNVSKDRSADEVYYGCINQYVSRFRTAPKNGTLAKAWYVPVYAGDHSSGVIMQIPRGTNLKDYGIPDDLAKTGKISLADAEKTYLAHANDVAKAIGLEILGNDTKRSALTSCEAPGVSNIGAKLTPDGKATFGVNRMCVFMNLDEEMDVKGGDESFIGTILARGYGVDLQRKMAKDPRSQILKLHYLSCTGSELTMIKGLTFCVSDKPDQGESAFLEDSATSAIAQYVNKTYESIDKGIRNLSTVVAMDFDALKVGIGNSKSCGVMVAGEQKPLFKQIFSLIKKDIAANGGEPKSYSVDAINNLLAQGSAEPGKFLWHYADGRGEAYTTLDELLPDSDFKIDVVEGLHGDKALAINYIDNSIMSYSVANVSHEAVPTLGRTPRNNMIDAITMAANMIRSGAFANNPGVGNELLKLISNYGLVSSLIGTYSEDGTNVLSGANNSQALNDLVTAGEAVHGINYDEQLARDVFKRLVKSMNVPMYKIDSALVTSGAIYDDESGKVVDNTKSEILRALHKGSRVFSKADAKFYKTSRRLGFAQVNVRDDGFRYTWFLDMDKLKGNLGNKDFRAEFGFAESEASDTDDRKSIVEAIEKIFTVIHDADLALREAIAVGGKAVPPALKKQRLLRKHAFTIFRDYSCGAQINDGVGGGILETISDKKLKYTDPKRFEKVPSSLRHNDYAYSVGIEDLFITDNATGKRMFDRAAIYDSIPDPFAKQTGEGKNKGVKTTFALGGSTIGIPRTPSYNGSMWAQTARASLPASFALDKNNNLMCGYDAMLMPDPQILKILGCDHDGDKTQCYMYYTDVVTGLTDADYDIPDPEYVGGAFTSSMEEKSKYLETLLEKKVIQYDQKTNSYSISRKKAVSNKFVQGLFDISRSILVDPTDEEQDFYRTKMARGTKAHPLQGKWWDDLAAKGDANRNYMKGGHRLYEVDVAAHVATSSQSSDKARGTVVSLAALLHLAQFSGKFNKGSKVGELFSWGSTEMQKWVDFIYNFDGISNASFDDIKEQICGRLGWTDGMMDSVLIDLIFSGEAAPTTDEEFFNALARYVESYDSTKKGSRYFMYCSATPANNNAELTNAHTAIQEFFKADALTGDIYRTKLPELFGVTENDKHKYSFKDGADKNSLTYRFIEAVAAVARTDKYKDILGKHDSLDFAIRHVINDVSFRRGHAAGAGYVYWLLNTPAASGEEINQRAVEYLKWSLGRELLSTVRQFNNSFNFTKVDPGSGAKIGEAVNYPEAFDKVMKDGPADGVVDNALTVMHTATTIAYDTEGLLTRQGRMGAAVERRDEAIILLAKALKNYHGATDELTKLVTKLFGLDALRSTDLLELEGNLQSTMYFMAAMQSMPECKNAGTDVMSGNCGEDAWNTFDVISEAVAKSTLPSELKNTKDTFLLQNGIEAMMNVMYSLVATSKENARCPAFMFLSSREDESFGPRKGKKGKMVDQYLFANKRRRILPSFRDLDSTTASRVATFVKRVRGDGAATPEFDTATRTSLYDGSTFKNGFTLSKENLIYVANELGAKVDKKSKTWDKDIIEGLRANANRDLQLVDDVIIVTNIIKQLSDGRKGKDKDVSITPSMMFKQFLPVYTTFTSRTTGAPTPGSSSLLSLLPGTYAQLSAKQVLFDSGVLDLGHKRPAGYSIWDILNTAALGKINIAKSFNKPGRLDQNQVRSGDVLTGLRNINTEHLGDVPFKNTDEGRKLVALTREKTEDGLDLPIRTNPEHRHVLDIMGTAGIFRDLHRYINQVIVDRQTGTIEETRDTQEEADAKKDFEANRKVIGDEEKDPEIEHLVDIISASLGKSLGELGEKVPIIEYKGGRSFTIRWRFRGLGATLFKGYANKVLFQDATGTVRDSIDSLGGVITVHVGNSASTIKRLEQGFTAFDINSPYVAASFCAAARGALGISADNFALLTPVEKMALLEAFTKNGLKYGPKGVSLSKPSWELSGEGIATLAGAINITSAKDVGTFYHEYFHSMCSMFKMMGVFSKADKEALREQFGAAPKGTKMDFDEEAAAEAYRKFMMGMGADKKVETIFEKIWAFMKALYTAIQNGFNYTGRKDDNTLFSMVVSGHAALSESRLDELVGNEEKDKEKRARVREGTRRAFGQNDIGYGTAPEDLCQSVEFSQDFIETMDRELEHRADKYGIRMTAEEDAVRRLNKATATNRDAGDLAKRDETMTGAEKQLHDLLIAELNGEARPMVYDRSVGGFVNQPVRVKAVKELVIALYNARRTGKVKFPAQAKGDLYYSVGTTATVDGGEAKDNVAMLDDFTGTQAARPPNFLFEQARLAYAVATKSDDINAGTFGHADSEIRKRDVELLAKSLAYGTAQERNIIEFEERARNKKAYHNAWQRRLGVLKGGAKLAGSLLNVGFVPESIQKLIDEKMREIDALNVSKRKKEEMKREWTSNRLLQDASDKTNAYENMAYSTLLQMHDRLQAFSMAGLSKDRKFANEIDKKAHFSINDCAGFLLAGAKVTPASLIARLRGQLDAFVANGKRSDRVTRVTTKLIAKLDKFTHGCPSNDFFLAETEGFFANLGKLMDDVYQGVTRVWDDEKGEYGDYQRISDGTLRGKAKKNVEEYLIDVPAEAGNVDRDLIQGILKTFGDTVMTVAAAVKFYRECGITEGDWRDTFGITKVVKQPVDLVELTNNFGLGKKNLLDDLSFIETTCQPSFIMANYDEWIGSLVPEMAGQTRIRDMMLDTTRDFRAIVARFGLHNNWVNMLYGINRPEGYKILTLNETDRTHNMAAGGIQAIKQPDDPSGRKTRLGFNNYGNLLGVRDTTEYTFTKEQYQTVDLFFKAAAAVAGGDTKLITGFDDIRVSSGMSLDKGEYSWEAIRKKVSDFYTLYSQREGDARDTGRELPPIVHKLFRLGLMLNLNNMEDKDDEFSKFRIDYYNQVAEAIIAGVTAAQEKQLVTEGLQSDDPMVNDIILKVMEEKGVVICERDQSKTSLADGTALRTRGVLCMDCAKVFEMFKASKAYQTLLAAGRTPEMLDEKKLISGYMKIYREITDEVQKHPWLTNGDGRFFNNFNTPLPFFYGSGNFMYNANRAIRDAQSTATTKLENYEATFYSMMANVTPWQQASLSQLSMLHDYFGTDEEGLELRDAVARGEYAAGTKKAIKTGLELAADATSIEVAKAIYYKALEIRLMEAEGATVSKFGDTSAIDRMIKRYEDDSFGTGGTVAGATGLTAEQMFKLHGVLPASMQLGHRIQNSIMGITNALQFRTAQINMLFTKGRDGRPVAYMKPSALAVESSGIPDKIWAQVGKMWANCHEGLHYDITRSGIENVRHMYDILRDLRATSPDKKQIAGIPFQEIGSDDLDSVSIVECLAADDDPMDDETSKLNKLGSVREWRFTGSEASGYIRHLFQTPRVLGYTAKTKWLNRITSWSKACSVSYSFFFPIAAQWESPVAAVGALATLGSLFAPELTREHAETFRKIQSLFSGGKGWIDENFVGLRDALHMMDTNDPFLADLVVWAESMGITMSTPNYNPSEDAKGQVEADVRRLVGKFKEFTGSDHAGQVLESLLNTMFTRSSERAFTYVLNATKLAVACQMYAKLKAAAERQHKAFDPIRDLKKYAPYIDSEVGGVDPLRHAWAHPGMRAMLSQLMFSWQWTRTAWTAGGGALFEDMIFGGHELNKELRGYAVGRWIRMAGVVMFGSSMLIQFWSTLIGKIFGVGDDDDKWWTWQNENKEWMSGADITPVLRVLSKCETIAGWKRNHPFLMSWLPLYTGTDEANSKTGHRRYYIHFAKQAWEYFRWFTEPKKQTLSKLSMWAQRALEGIFGYNLASPDYKLPWYEMGVIERWLHPNGAGVNFMRTFMPFVFNGMNTFGDAGFISMLGPVSMGTSETAVLDVLSKRYKAWAENDRSAFRYGVPHIGTPRDILYDIAPDVLRDAKLNGMQPESVVDSALAKVTSYYYNELFKAIPKNAEDNYDVKEVARIARALLKLGRKRKGIRDSLKKKFEQHGTPWEELPEKYKDKIKTIVWEAIDNPYGDLKGRIDEQLRGEY